MKMQIAKVLVIFLSLTVTRCNGIHNGLAKLKFIENEIKHEIELQTVTTQDNRDSCNDRICRLNEENDVIFYLFAATGSTFGLLGMFLSLWMACRYVKRTYAPREDRLIPSSV